MSRQIGKLIKSASIDNVHRFRTNSRRIEALVAELARQSGNQKKLLKLLSKLRKKAGKVRDLDVQIAFLKGSRIECDWRHIMLRRLTVTGSTLRASPFERKAALARELKREVWPLLDRGELKTIIHATFPLAEAARAHALMESSQHIGKIMLAVRPQ